MARPVKKHEPATNFTMGKQDRSTCCLSKEHLCCDSCGYSFNTTLQNIMNNFRGMLIIGRNVVRKIPNGCKMQETKEKRMTRALTSYSLSLDEGKDLETILKRNILFWACGNWVQTFVKILCLCLVFNTISRQLTFKGDLSRSRKDYAEEKSFGPCEGKNLSERKVWQFIFRFHHLPKTRITAYPFSLNQYVNEIVREHKSGEEMMKYEWSRYLSFKTFPVDCVMTPMRLAQAGFYYTGRGTEVKCFCCGVTNGDWTTDETAIEVHRRLSPSCRFISGESTNNVEIHSDEYYTDILEKFRRSEIRMDSPETRINYSELNFGATGGPADTIGNMENFQRREQNDSAAKVWSQSKDRQTEIGASDQNQAGANVKHPEYADLTKRFESFHNSPMVNVQDPMSMAQAGFYYAGIKDFVRCYFCGTGLKNWVREDNPWSEHARWSKSCGHLLLCNRNGFQTSGPSRGHKGGEATTTANNNVTSAESTDIDSPAAMSVMEMGYGRDVVSEAIRKYRESHDTDTLSADAIIEIILDTDDDNNPAASADLESVKETEETSKSSTNTCERPTAEKHTSNTAEFLKS